MNTGTLFILYYSTLTASVLFYICTAYRCRLKLASASNFAFAYAMVILALPGYYVAEGTADQLIANRFHAGFDIQLYWIYFFFMPIVSVALIFGQVAGQRISIRTAPRKNLDSKVNLFIFILSVYGFMYLLWLPNIPLNNLLFSSSFNFADIYLQRISITHGLGYEEDLPFLFRYWRNLTQLILPALFYYFFVTRKLNNRRVWLLLFFFLYVLYLQLFTIEKGPFLHFLLGILLLMYLRRQNEPTDIKKKNFSTIFKYSAGLIAILVSIIFTYQFFMNLQYGDVWKSLFSRLMGQSSSDYLQIEYIRQIGFLGFSGIKMPILSNLLNIEYINPSKYAISIMYPLEGMGAAMGAAGGLSLANIYYIIGWLSVPAFFIFVFLFGYVDRMIINSIYNPNNKDSFYFNISFYAMCASIYAMSIGSSIWIVFGIPTILSASLIIMMVAYFIFIKVPGSIFVKKGSAVKNSFSAVIIENHN